jgi:hypothetical protein
MLCCTNIGAHVHQFPSTFFLTWAPLVTRERGVLCEVGTELVNIGLQMVNNKS